MRIGAAKRAVGGWLRALAPDRRTIKQDAIAGVPLAIGSVPDGMAAGVLAGVSPIHGLYASIAGPIGGGLTVSTKLMLVTTTSASALAAGTAVASVDPADRSDALFLLTLLAGVAMLVAAALRLGRYTRFVSHSVMTGFLTGVALNILLGQLPDLLGASASGPFPLAKALDIVVHPGRIDPATLAVGVAALAVLLIAGRTRLATFSAVLALALPTLALIVLGDDGVVLVSDSGSIPSGLPTPGIPDLGLLTLPMVTGALSIAAIVLVQGAGVRESSPSPDGVPSSVDGDFVGQGVGNLCSGVIGGMPVGASVGQTALSVSVGARSRWASILSGVWMLVILLAFAGIVGKVAIATLAAVLILASVGAIQPAQIATIWRTGPASQIALVATFVATLLLSIPVAVGIGVVLSLILQLNREAVDLRVTELVPLGDGRFRERPAPAAPRSEAVTLLDAYGSLLFAGARTLQARLPDPAGTTRPAVVLRLRGHLSLGATFIVVVRDYAERLDAAGGRLFLSGVDPQLLERLRRTQTLDEDRAISVDTAEEIVGRSSGDAYAEAERWLAEQRHEQASPAAGDERSPADPEA